MLRRWLFALVCVLIAGSAHAQSIPFSWDHATIYHIVTDRFSNGNSDNNGAYGRGLDGDGSPYTRDPNGHFQGGDFEGITAWIEDGYFAALGVNVLLITAPFEQVHGWIGTGSGFTQTYGFHGDWPMDYTRTDNAFGTGEEFQRLVDTAHGNGLKILFDVQFDHPGPATLHDMAAFNFGDITTSTWRSWRPSGGSTWDAFRSYFLESNSGPSGADRKPAWLRWWGPDWVRTDFPGYESCTQPMGCGTSTMARFKVDSAAPVGLPAFLELKWGPEETQAEKAELSSFFDRTQLPASVAAHLVKWTTDWVSEYGIDGLVVHYPGELDPQIIAALQAEGDRSLAAWRRNHGVDAADAAAFWIGAVGAADGLERGVASDTSLVLTDGPASATFSAGGARGQDAPIVRISGADIGLGGRSHPVDAGTRLLLHPGPVLIYYGDESGRTLGSSDDPAIAAMSMMNWESVSEETLRHWRKLGDFRGRHPSVARGGNEVLQEAPYAAYRGLRVGPKTDEVVIATNVQGRIRLNVGPIWPDDTVLRDAYTGKVAIVSFGQVSFEADPAGVVLIEEAE